MTRTVAPKTLVLGGARSGKSAHAEGLMGDVALYLATARRIDGDGDWDARIAAHVARRPATWRTEETPDTDSLIGHLDAAITPVLVDDIATWLANAMDDANAWDGGVDMTSARSTLVHAVERCAMPVTLVSAEVGLGVVPPTRSGRLFRDELGAVNASLAEVCTDVLLLVAGLPLRLK
ncbi:bifunctional adenosylcobinamide kinase/adenosylcobinamide-phosphate guanylyltransferase [Actinokineospora sp. UTMC 2448]|uniref:bifunctional adenosylcobinamide kinase/adenosylcobinamide-phosphate guanylyltransferase n=1 Tax=Actinokineospora sp. UTMC 2448 TaxID=2268449 RepID=UPI0021646D98|nr:bifunctional adenosylcobinamide kinase/adenosylcobinamide-phosphate guanylyltransferase [Actinokineospora sp. UTMC 2448]